MKRVIPAAALLVALVGSFPRSASATEVGNARRVGLGVAIGDPTGFVGKVWLAGSNAFDFGVAFYGYGYCSHRYKLESNRGNNFSVSGDYLWEQPLSRTNVRLNWHIGVGGRLVFYTPDGFADEVAAGVRMPLGLDLSFNNPSFLEVFFELSPIFYISPRGWLDFEPVLGARFYF
jgi:hypothetical protein